MNNKSCFLKQTIGKNTVITTKAARNPTKPEHKSRLDSKFK